MSFHKDIKQYYDLQKQFEELGCFLTLTSIWLDNKHNDFFVIGNKQDFKSKEILQKASTLVYQDHKIIFLKSFLEVENALIGLAFANRKKIVNSKLVNI